ENSHPEEAAKAAVSKDAQRRSNHQRFLAQPLRSTHPPQLRLPRSRPAEWSGRQGVKITSRNRRSALHFPTRPTGGMDHAIQKNLGGLPSRSSLAATGIVPIGGKAGIAGKDAICRG